MRGRLTPQARAQNAMHDADVCLMELSHSISCADEISYPVLDDAELPAEKDERVGQVATVAGWGARQWDSDPYDYCLLYTSPSPRDS